MRATPARSAAEVTGAAGAAASRGARGRSRRLLPLTAAVVLALTASGCVTVHGEREVIPATSPAGAARALTDFLAAYNEADEANDPSLDADRVTGALGAIDRGTLRARRATAPLGNPQHVPLKLTDVKYAIPEAAGWPKFFLADTDSDRDVDDDPARDTRWLLVFTKTGPDARWQVAFLTILSPDEVPELRTRDGDRGEDLAAPVALDEDDLTVPPEELAERYTTYLAKGGPGFLPGPHTDRWRTERERGATRPGLSRQYVDQPVEGAGFAPVGLRTADGGALVFFATRHFEKQTVARGRDLKLGADVRALLRGDAKQSVTLEFTSNQAVRVPPRAEPGKGVEVLSRIQGLTGAKGE
ncbi:hypothetical protein [Streptomyces sp. NPDC002490]|uniref:hypothetical protein n=1 Tax=Streptomyces sp. NPDC002490 TaxID=3154416 RepID=UPI003329506D